MATTPCGWFVTVYERGTGKVWEEFGGASGGTNNYAELEPFNFALWAYRHFLKTVAKVRTKLFWPSGNGLERREWHRQHNKELWR